MKIKKLLFLIIGLLALPFVTAATFVLHCPQTTSPTQSFSCTLDYTNLDPDNFGGFDFTIVTSDFSVKENPTTDYGSLFYNPTTKTGSLMYDFGGIPASGTLFTINFLPVENIGAQGQLSLSGLKFYDVDSVASDIASLSATLTISSSPSTFTCTAPPLHTQLCSGDDQGLTANTASTLVSSCTNAAKCEYTCSPTYQKSDNNCISSGEPLTLGQQIDQALADEQGEIPHDWTIDLISKIANILKNWFTPE